MRQVQDLVDQIELLEQPKLSEEETLAKWEETVDNLKSFLSKTKEKFRR